MITAADALQGLRPVRDSHPDVVLSDIRMPDRNWFGLLQDIRALDPENGGMFQSLLWTAYAESTGREGTIAAGFQERLNKPFYPNQLLEAMIQF
jgi:CheY-like chemotaxis protein